MSAWRYPVVNFAADRGQHRRRHNQLWVMVAILVGVELGGLAWRLQSLEAEKAALEDQQQRLHVKRDAPPLAPGKELVQKLTGVRGMLGSLSIPWENLLLAIEAAKDEHIVVEGIHPDPKDESLEITITAGEFGQIRDFVRRLASADFLRSVMLVSESVDTSPASAGTSGAIRATLTARWQLKGGQ